MAPKGRADRDRRMTFTVRLDRRGLEALQLEMRRLARGCGLAVGSVRVQTVINRRSR
jgi:hypothetical protein